MGFEVCRQQFDDYVEETLTVAVSLQGGGTAEPVSVATGQEIEVRVVLANHPDGERDTAPMENPVNGINFNDVRLHLTTSDDARAVFVVPDDVEGAYYRSGWEVVDSVLAPGGAFGEVFVHFDPGHPTFDLSTDDALDDFRIAARVLTDGEFTVSAEARVTPRWRTVSSPGVSGVATASTGVARTVGDVRAAIVAMGDRGWTIAADLRDDEPLPEYGHGGELSTSPLAAAVAPSDFAQLIACPIANPLLRARNRELQFDFVHLDLVPVGRVDWRDRWGGRWLATVQDQNPCNNCWAFAATALVETMVRIEHGLWAKRSEGDLRDGWGGPTGENWVVRDGPTKTPCVHGAGVTGALDWITANGLADPDCYAWSSMDQTYAPTPDRQGRTVRIPRYQDVGDVAATKQWLDSIGPVVAAFDAYDDFSAYGGPGVYHKIPAAIYQDLHFVLVVGYDDAQQCWIIRNSWGAGWGTGGYGLIGYGECKIDTYPKQGLTGTNPDPWSKRRLHAGLFLESGNGAEHRNFEMVCGSAPRVRHLWRDGGSGGFVWHEAATLESPSDIAAGAGCVGHPAATATTYNRNFEAVYWELSGRLRHWWMDQHVNAWHDSGPFGPADTEGYPAFIQSNYGAPGNLEVVVRRRGGRLAHWWREGEPHYRWHDGGTITDGVRMSGPSLVQANVGRQGNLYVVCVTDFATMQLWWRDDDNDHAWKRGEVFGHHVGVTPVCMIQGQYGATDELTPGNFELCVALGGAVQHWWRDNSTLRDEPPRADFADPRVSDRISQEQSPRRVALRRESTADDLRLLLGDEAHLEVATSARLALGSAVLSGDVGMTIAEEIAAAERVTATERPSSRWHLTGTFGHDVKHVWGLLQGSFGFNLDVVVETTAGELQHYYRDGDAWHEGVVIAA